MYTADNIGKIIEFLIDNIFVQFGGCLFRQLIGIPVGTNCAPLLADLFLYSYENEFLPDNMIRSGHRRLARLFNLCYRYIDDLIVFNKKKFLYYLKEIYPSQLTVEKANKSDHLADHLDLIFIIDSGGKLSTRLYANVIILTSTLSIFHSFPATYHLALLMVCILHSSLDMHDALLTMMISDIATSAWLIDFCHKALEA